MLGLIEAPKVDRTQFVSGEWDNEPDMVCNNYRGHDYVIIRTDKGILCGFVCVPEHNEFYGISYREMPEIMCYGGLTCSGFDCDGNWWVGFRTDKPWDFVPHKDFVNILGAVYKSIQFVRNECEYIIDELKGY